jgi:hypothetical protein
MAGDERFIGKDFFASFTPQGGSAIILTEDYRNYTGERSLQEVDLTAGGDDNERFATAFRRGTFGFVVLQGIKATARVSPKLPCPPSSFKRMKAAATWTPCSGT